jgi:hypothetical protein
MAVRFPSGGIGSGAPRVVRRRRFRAHRLRSRVPRLIHAELAATRQRQLGEHAPALVLEGAAVHDPRVRRPVFGKAVNEEQRRSLSAGHVVQGRAVHRGDVGRESGSAVIISPWWPASGEVADQRARSPPRGSAAASVLSRMRKTRTCVTRSSGTSTVGMKYAAPCRPGVIPTPRRLP